MHKVLLRFIEEGTIILLSTPQRLLSKPFIESLLPFCVTQEEFIVVEHAEEIMITVMVLQKMKLKE